MREEEIRQFLTHLAVTENVAASTQNQAFAALLFLYRNVLSIELQNLNAVRAKKSKQLPVVFIPEQVRQILARLSGVPLMAASLLYGAGLRVSEVLCLRVKDLDFQTSRITVREGTGEKERLTMLPQSIKELLTAHLERVKQLHEDDLRNGFGEVYLPYALER